MRHADHKLIVKGTWEGDFESEMACLHDDTEYYTDNEGKRHDYCLVMEWYDNDGRDVLGHSTTLTPQGHILFWTTWNYASEPLLVGRDQYREWKEIHDQDQADD